jgi:hypothetical protein
VSLLVNVSGVWYLRSIERKVKLMENKKSMWAVGIRYEGAIYLFQTEAEARAYLANPEGIDKELDLYIEELPIR